ncbi:hypothetical protein [Jannaschia rubra]|uniref:Uncharacterized protein n=1 Tax=Jannaschia rubra TaxID=282197 RepID=A0A0M6XKV0_9RHOB|nr:hypothetical protein [Jannaschia rubra]CTQ31729.1 hypothetical protein JAN5088_00488 [Jannaschia rubra]SFG55350.1 hypothetical protein SAMN04488517_106137 [Jannaschia rubra]
MILRAAALVALTAGTAAAQGLSPAETDVLPRVIGRLDLNLDEDRNGYETAMLLVSDDDPHLVDLVILSDRHDAPVEVLAVAPGIVWDGPMWGQGPGLEASDAAADRMQSLRVVSGNEGVGGTAWNQTLTIAFREGRFVLAGYAFSSRDRLNTAWSLCDVNLLTGAWETGIGIGALDGYDEAASGLGTPDIREVSRWVAEGSSGTTDRPAVCDDAFKRIRELSEVQVPD